MATFGERFKLLRNEREMNQEELINNFNKKYNYGFTKSAVSQYENDKRIPEISALSDFADYFGVSLDYLLGRTDIKNPYKKDTDEEITTIAAHFDGDEFTEEELKEIEQFKEFVKMRKQQREK